MDPYPQDDQHIKPNVHRNRHLHLFGSKDVDKGPLEGSWHFNGQMTYRRPPQWTRDVEKGLKDKPECDYKNKYGHVEKIKAPGVETYLSPTRCIPRKLVVQANLANGLKPCTEWNQRPVKGSVPTAVRLSEWTLNPILDKSGGKQVNRWIGVPLFVFRTLLVALPLQWYMSLPIFTPPWDDEAEESYVNWQGCYWEWPKFAVNPLDMSPDSPHNTVRKLSAQPRLIRPRLLIVQDEQGEWKKKNLDKEPKSRKPYIMLSFANRHFNRGSEDGRTRLNRIAVEQCRHAGLQAYWLDFECSEPKDGELKDADINRFCDVVRGASRVVIALPNNTPEAALVWGKRIWTLSEGLLAPGNILHLYYEDSDTTVERTKIELADMMWKETDNHRPNDGQDAQATRILAEHYVGTVQLSRLELISTAVAALSDRRDAAGHRIEEMAHALMGFLNKRIDPIEKGQSTLFQEIAKLSLLNDNDQLIERMVCLHFLASSSPSPSLVPPQNSAAPVAHPQPNRVIFEMLFQADKFGTHLWDIHPTCEVVGVDSEDNTIILNNCRAIGIRWKKFPRMKYTRTESLKKLLAEIFLRSGAWWFVAAASLTFTYAPFWISDFDAARDVDEGRGTSAEVATTDGIRAEIWLAMAVLLFLGVGTILSLAGPISLRLLYGGTVVRPTPRLVGFEGTMPIKQLERIVFGNYDGRLNYAPSSTPFCLGNRDERERRGKEPEWVAEPGRHSAPELSDGENRLFTLVDTGSLEVSIFEARYPPTVALLCGSEGGMLRAVLCRWDFISDCLYKETVVRMRTEALDMASRRGWLRVCLGRSSGAAAAAASVVVPEKKV